MDMLVSVARQVCLLVSEWNLVKVWILLGSSGWRSIYHQIWLVSDGIVKSVTMEVMLEVLSRFTYGAGSM